MFMVSAASVDDKIKKFLQIRISSGICYQVSSSHTINLIRINFQNSFNRLCYSLFYRIFYSHGPCKISYTKYNVCTFGFGHDCTVLAISNGTKEKCLSFSKKETDSDSANKML